MVVRQHLLVSRVGTGEHTGGRIGHNRLKIGIAAFQLLLGIYHPGKQLPGLQMHCFFVAC